MNKQKESRTGSPRPFFGSRLARAAESHPLICCLVAGLVMNLLIYLLHARSIFGGIRAILQHPFYFLFNALIILGTYALALLFKRRIFALSFVSIAWFAIGVTNCVLLGMRVAPLEGIDFYIVRTGIVLLPTYMSPLGIVLTAVGILGAILLLVLLFIRSPRVKIDYIRTLLTVVCCLLVLAIATFCVVNVADANPRNFENPKEANDVYGFPYCFLRSILERGIPEPEDYSAEQLRALLDELSAMETDPPASTPNVIFLQLESFFNVNRVRDLQFSENPLPNFTALLSEYSHGFLSVPSIGGGTANTEFEVLSGLDLGFFGTGEYPYESILGENCCETIAYDLAALGYTTHGMHNHTGTFYDRYAVYANLGFDTFTSAEHMQNVEYNALGWETDAVLADYILKALDSTDGQDFVFAVSVQGHGGYPEVPTGEQLDLTLSGIENDENRCAMEYYANQIHQMDAVIGSLLETLAARGEQTVVVLYGDHLPALNLTEEQLTAGDLFSTEYVIWSNFEMPHTEQNLEAYELFPFVLNKLDIETGLINKIHQFATEDEKSSLLELAGYDMLYGDRYAFGGTLPYAPRDTKMGLDPFRVTEIAFVSETEFFILGEGFTPYSRVFINGDRVDAIYVAEDTMYVENGEISEGDTITLAQISADFRKLGQTEPFTVPHGFRADEPF